MTKRRMKTSINTRPQHSRVIFLLDHSHQQSVSIRIRALIGARRRRMETAQLRFTIATRELLNIEIELQKVKLEELDLAIKRQTLELQLKEAEREEVDAASDIDRLLTLEKGEKRRLEKSDEWDKK